jgi:zinc protease
MQKYLTLFLAVFLIPLLIHTTESLAQAGKDTDNKQKQHAEQLTVKEILSKHYDAIGGDEAWKLIETLKFTGSMYTKDTTFKTAGIYKRPNICRVDYQSGRLYFMEAYDGKVAWQMNPTISRKPEILKGKRASEMMDTCDFDGLLIDYEGKGHKIRYMGTENIEGRNAYLLEVKSRTGNTDIYYLDKKTYLPFMIKGETTIQDQTVDTTIKLDEYIEIENIKIPFSYEFIVDGNPSSENLKIKTIELNSEFDDDIFHLPKQPRDLR